MKAINEINKLYIKNKILFIEGLAYLDKYNSPDHSYLKKHLCLLDLKSNQRKEFKLGSTNRNDMLAVQQGKETFNYRAAGVATIGFKGIELSGLDIGIYEIQISVSKDDKKTYYSLNLGIPELDIRNMDNRYEYRLFRNQNKAFLVKREILGRIASTESYISIDESWVTNNKFHIEGKFIIPGVDITEFNQAQYYLIVKKPSTQAQYAFELGQVKKINLNEFVHNPFGGYNACYYATKNLSGIDSKGFEFGTYDLYISLSYKSEIFTTKLNRQLVVSEEGCQLISNY